MANRLAANIGYTMVKGVYILFARINIGATGAPTLQKWNPSTRTYTAAPTTGAQPYSIGCEGIKSISRVSAGVYNLLLQDTYQRFLVVNGTVSNATGLPTSISIGLWTTGTDVTTLATGIKFTTLSATGVAADPANGDVINLEIVLQNASVI
jgi:hypothetical protein